MTFPDWLERLLGNESISVAQAINISRSNNPRWKTLLVELSVPYESAAEVIEISHRKRCSVLQALNELEKRRAREKTASDLARKAEREAARQAQAEAAAEARKVTDFLRDLELKRIAIRKRKRAASSPVSVEPKKRRKVSLVESVKRFEEAVKRSKSDPVGRLKSSLDEWERLLDGSPETLTRSDAETLADLLTRAKRVAIDSQRDTISRCKAVVDKMKALGLLPGKPWVKVISTPMGGQTKRR